MNSGKTLPLLLGLSISLSAVTNAQVSTPAVGPGAAELKDYRVTERGPHHRVWSQTIWLTNEMRSAVLVTNSFVELATGLHYRDPKSAEWQESNPGFQLNEEGYAVASHCQHQVIVAPSLNPKDGVVVDLLTPDGKRLRSGILGLNLFDPVSGRSLQIAAVRDVAGTLVSSNEIVWLDAFEGLQADVRVRNEPGEFHQDVLLREKLTTKQLAALGFDPASARLQIWTEFVEAPPAAVATTVLRSETNAALRAKMAEPDQKEDLLDFGEMKMTQGRAFVEKGDGAAAGIFKQWREIQGRRFLIENASYLDLLPLLEPLPVKTAALKKRTSSRYAGGWIPPERTRTSQGVHAFQIVRTSAKMLAASSPQVVLDYIIVTSQPGYPFSGDQTYYVNGNVNLTGTTTFEGGTVIKYAANKAINIISPGIAQTTAAAYRPVIFTAKDDNTVGQPISGSSPPQPGVYYANPALDLRTVGNPPLENLRFAYAQQAITLGSGISLSLANVQFVKCNYGVGAGYYQSMTLNLRNGLFSQVQTPFELSQISGGATISAEHVTFDSAPAFVREGFTAAYGLQLTNCILANVTSLGWPGSASAHLNGRNNGFFNATCFQGFGSDNRFASVTPFQTVGAGNYYLADITPSFRNAGTGLINSDLALALKSRTTFPPTTITANITSPQALPMQAARDMDTPDLGYHYDPLDWAVNYVSVSPNVTVTLQSGVAVGFYGGLAGFQLGSGARLESQGGPVQRVSLARYTTVQEQPLWWARAGTQTGGAYLWGQPTAACQVSLNATDVYLAGAKLGHDYLAVVTGSGLVSLSHSQVFGGRLSLMPYYQMQLDVSWFNNLFWRTTANVEDAQSPWRAVNLSAYNNLFFRGSLGLQHNYYTAWQTKDNAFDGVGLTAAGSAWGYGGGNSRNGYINTAVLPGSSGGDVSLTSFTYQDGPGGKFYHQSTNFRDQGSRTAASAGLDGHTTQTDETPDTSTVDIGFHYPLVACNLLPFGFTINLDTTPQGLQIKSTAQTTPLPFVNVASSGRGTVARIEVPNPWNPLLPASRVAGEYYTTPGSAGDTHGIGNPSRTTVDRYGNVWVGNRNIGAAGFGSVTKIGVVIGGIRCNQNGSGNDDGDYVKPNPALPGGFIYNTCIDRDGDGLIRTSPGRLANGSLRRLDWASESLPPGDGDEAVIYYVRTTPTQVRSLAVGRDNNVWVGSRENGWQELIDDATGAPITGEKFLYGSGGYGAVFDPYGVLWSAGYGSEGLLWRPPGVAANVMPGTAGGILPDTPGAYGIGIDPTTADVWLGGYLSGGLWQFKQGGCMNKFRFAAPDNPQGDLLKGIVLDGSGDVWVAHAKYESEPSGEAVYRFRNTGEYRGRVVLTHPTAGVTGKSPHGVCIDSQQRVWAICFRPAEDGKYYALRIDPTQGVDPTTGNIVGQVVEAVDLGTFPAFDGDFHGPYNYSDMSGFVTLAATQPAGVWDYVEDSGTANMRWLRVTLDTVLNSGDLYVEVRAANSVTDLPAWPFCRLNGSSGALALDGLGIKGRFVEVRVTLLRSFGAAQGPLLKTLCISHGTAGTALQIVQHPKSVTVQRGDPSDAVSFNATASGTGLHYQWSKDGASVGTDNPTLTINNAQYANAGKYKVRVTDSTGAFLDSAEARLHVVSTPAPFSRPETQLVGNNPFPLLNNPVTFTASMNISPSVGPVRYQWRKNGVPIAGANGLCNDTQSPLYTANPYSVAHVAYPDTGEYSVVFTNDYWKSASVGIAITVLGPEQVVNDISITHADGTPYPMPIENQNDPPKLTVTTWVTPACVQWYRTDSNGGTYGIKEPLGPGVVTGSSPPYTLTYTFPNPVPCALVRPPDSWNYFRVEIFDAGRFRYVSPNWPNVSAVAGACQ